MTIKLQLNRGIIVIDAFIKGVHKVKGNKANKTILIVFQQLFGDSIVMQSSLDAYTRLFPVSEGYKIRFLVRPSVLAFMKANLPLPKEMEFEPVDFNKFLEDYKYYKEIVNRYRGLASIVIVPGTSLSAEIFTSAMDAERKIGLVRSIDVKRPWIMAVFAKLAYNERVRPNKEDMMLQRHRKLLCYLGDTRYQAVLPNLLPKEQIIEGQYAVVCPGSSKAEKCWPIKKFAEITDYMIEKFRLPIHLCGGAGEEFFAEQMSKLSSYPDKIISHIGSTSFSDWSAIVQHAKIVIGNDSATLHLAAAGRVRAVCIAGVYDKYQFFPYKVDKLGEDDFLPVTVLRDMPCRWCRTKGYDAGYGNKRCKNKSGGVERFSALRRFQSPM